MKHPIHFIKKAAAVLAALTVCSVSSAECLALTPETAFSDPDWNGYVERYIEEDDIPGIAFAAVSGDEVSFWNRGYADLAETQPVTEDTPFHIGSCTKAFTALSVLLLQEEGKLSIDDSISDYLPWWHVTYRGAEADVKIWHLLNHCSGIPDSRTMARIPWGSDPSLKEKAARLSENIELSHAPGEQFDYCNLGYDILAYLTETVSGMPFSEYVTQEILRPIGMTHSGYDLPTATGHIWFFGRQKAYTEPPAISMQGDGLIVTTPADMTLWMKAQLGGLELPEKLKNAIEVSHSMPDSHRAVTEARRPYFNGWMAEDGNRFEHTGQNSNFMAMIIIDCEKDIGVFAATNCLTEAIFDPARKCYDLIAGDKPGSFYSFPDTEEEMLKSYDRMATYMAIACTVLLFISLVLIVTQKRRLAGRRSSGKREKRLFTGRMAVLLPLLGFSLYLPCIYGLIGGYSGMGCKVLWNYGMQSPVVACLILDAALLCMILSVILRYIRTRHSE